MGRKEMFSEFLESLKVDLKQAKKISYHYRRITKSLNFAIRSTNSRVANRLKVGSIGRHTAIRGISDLDMLYIMPANKYEYYDSKENGQSKLLTDIRNILAEEYPEQTVKKDRLVVQVIFKHFHVEVQPVFKQADGSFKYPESYQGGSWKITKPAEEITAMTTFTRDKSKNLRKLCKMARAWKNKNGVNMGGLLIDTLVYKFLDSTPEYDSTGDDCLGYLSRDFFEFLSNEERRARYHALGSSQHVKVKSPWFGRAAANAYSLCCDAINSEGAANEHDKWRKVFGRAFPVRKAVMLEKYNGIESLATDSSVWEDTEEFIEERYPVDIKHHIELDCTVTQNGYQPQSLQSMLLRGFKLSPKKSLLFKIDIPNITVEEPYSILWKVLNVGDQAQRKNLIRGQLVLDNGSGTKKESTDFQGDHIVECYVIKDDVVVGRAEIKVPIN
ncbi:nucleotide-binding domain-containing protein [Yersinia enterocolitica]|uniref:nucleotide-binding domain-containing protein n=1 Tax=Yersinia enterocolitica TaxID=630 RepID=UPI001C608E71|nr:nucleotidyltransferase [Yersinia enterocolitica]MBW5852823.1 nucleotidyltransferase [Yersinia enterocolitica]